MLCCLMPCQAKLAARRRDEFLRSFSFSKTEREEAALPDRM